MEADQLIGRVELSGEDDTPKSKYRLGGWYKTITLRGAMFTLAEREKPSAIKLPVQDRKAAKRLEYRLRYLVKRLKLGNFACICREEGGSLYFFAGLNWPFSGARPYRALKPGLVKDPILVSPDLQ